MTTNNEKLANDYAYLEIYVALSSTQTKQNQFYLILEDTLFCLFVQVDLLQQTFTGECVELDTVYALKELPSCHGTQ